MDVVTMQFLARQAVSAEVADALAHALLLMASAVSTTLMVLWPVLPPSG